MVCSCKRLASGTRVRSGHAGSCHCAAPGPRRDACRGASWLPGHVARPAILSRTITCKLPSLGPKTANHVAAAWGSLMVHAVICVSGIVELQQLLCAVCLQMVPSLRCNPARGNYVQPPSALIHVDGGTFHQRGFCFYSSKVGQRQMDSFDGEGSMLPFPVLAVVQLDLALGFLNPQRLDFDAVVLGAPCAVGHARVRPSAKGRCEARLCVRHESKPTAFCDLDAVTAWPYTRHSAKATSLCWAGRLGVDDEK